MDKSKLGIKSNKHVEDRNGCQGDGCRTYSVNLNRHTNGKTAHKAENGTKTPTRKPATETIMLDTDGAIKLSEFKRIIDELIAVGKRVGAYDNFHEQVRQELVGIVNDAFGYSPEDASASPMSTLDGQDADGLDDVDQDSDEAARESDLAQMQAEDAA